MSKGKWKFATREVTRILKAVMAVGMQGHHLEFRPDGTIVLVPGGNAPEQPERNEWDED